ncbi:hypothetical protein P4O66_023121, partial [Electrophorus voltai]
ELQDTLIIDISNAHCGPGSIPGLRLSEGRYSYLSDLPSQAGPRLEVRTWSPAPEKEASVAAGGFSPLWLPTFSLLFSPPAQADHGKVSVLFRYVRERREVVVTCVPPPPPVGCGGGRGSGGSASGVFLTGRPVRGTSVTSRPVSSLARVKRDSSPNPAVFTLLGNPPERTRERPQIRRDNPLNLSILLSGGKETNKDSLSSGERRGKSPALNPPSGGKRVGSAQSARGIQPGGEAVPVARVCSASKPPAFPLRGVASGAAGPPRGAGLGRRRAHFLRGGAPRPAPVRLGRVRGRRWLVSSGLELYSALPPRLRRLPPGAAGEYLRAFLPLRGPRTGPLRSRRGCRPGRTVLSPSPDRAAPPGRGPALVPKGARGRRRCRLPTRPVLKHGPRSLTHARVKGLDETPYGAMKVKAGARRPRWDPPRYGGGRTTGPSLPLRRGGGARGACDGTRKMVNYAWAGRSQRKLWWRPAAVLTCKSVVRPGYRGERLIEPSSSGFPPPKFPSG